MDELRHYYQTVGDNPNVHFIAHDPSQIERGQEIYISTSDKVLVDNSQQHIIVNQPAYTNQQYIIQGTTVDSGQPIVYMEDGMSMLVTQIAQPINVCTTLGNNIQRVVTPVMNMKTVEKTHNITLLSKSVRQEPQQHQIKRIVEKPQSMIPAPIQKAIATTTNNLEISSNKQEVVTLADGHVISAADYKKLLAPKRARNPNPKPRGGKQPTKLIERKVPLKSVAQAMSSMPENQLNTNNPPIMLNQQPNQYMHRQTQQQQPIQPKINQAATQPSTEPSLPIPRSQIQKFLAEQSPVVDDCGESIRMLVLLANGELRLITFTIPKEQCTIYEILEQIGIVVDQDMKVDPMESDINGINYIVSVGMPNPYRTSDTSNKSDDSISGTTTSSESLILKESNNLINQHSQQPEHVQQQQQISATQQFKPQEQVDAKENPRYVPGKLAVCTNCGYLSEDFNKCLRCRRKLPDDVKSMAANTNIKQQNNKHKIAIPSQTQVTTKLPVLASPAKTNPRKKISRSKIVEHDPIVLTLSSDDEEDTSKGEEHLTKNMESSVYLSAMKKEPSMNELQQLPNQDSITKYNTSTKINETDGEAVSIFCRTIRIGSYKIIYEENVTFDGASLIIKVPNPKNGKEQKVITLNRESVVKVLVTFHDLLPVIFYYTVPSFGKKVRDILGMQPGDECYFDPISKEEPFKRIALVTEYITNEAKLYLKQIYGKPFSIIEELSIKEANNILLKTYPKEVNKVIVPQTSNFSDIRQLLIYPPGKGGLSINTEDYMCLAQDQFLNDVIIDFYLKYLVIHLPADKQNKVHVFSTFFYNRLTTKPSRLNRRNDSKELDPNLTAAEKRHARVSKWTKNVNLFEKDFIIVPINENCHWFLAIICFPNLNGPTTFDGKPVKIEPIQKKKEKPAAKQNITITQTKIEKEETEMDEDEASNKDEADGDESELESDDDGSDVGPEEIATATSKTPIKQPCIFIFDSLACSRRARVIATLRDYLTVEYKTKLGKEKLFTKDVIKGSNPRVPQQTNFTDCGLYLLQFVESFFKDPILSYHLPIKTLKNWFEEFTVTKKREEISNLIKDLMVNYNKDTSCMPEILFPTINGKLRVEEDEGDDEEEESFEGEMMEEESSNNFSSKNDESKNTEATDEQDIDNVSTKVICNNTRSSSGLFTEEKVVAKPDLSEIQKQSNRETLSYLKAKRIIRHKVNETDSKKLKLDE